MAALPYSPPKVHGLGDRGPETAPTRTRAGVDSPRPKVAGSRNCPNRGTSIRTRLFPSVRSTAPAASGLFPLPSETRLEPVFEKLLAYGSCGRLHALSDALDRSRGKPDNNESDIHRDREERLPVHDKYRSRDLTHDRRETVQCSRRALNCHAGGARVSKFYGIGLEQPSLEFVDVVLDDDTCALR